MSASLIHDTFEQGKGIFRLLPAFVPFRFNQAGGRLRLHPDDYYPLGLSYGSIKERWFCSTLQTFGKDSSHQEIGLSLVGVSPNLGAGPDSSQTFSFRDTVQELGADLIGTELWEKYQTWPMHAKFFDNKRPLFHHLHLRDANAAALGWPGKPEAYYFPVQLNNYPGDFPLTYYGFDPWVTKDQVKERLKDWEHRDTRITELSRAYRLELGTGWYTPPGVLHAPGSFLTYEPQWNSLVGGVFENVSSGEANDMQGIKRSLPEDKKDDLDAILELLDWEKNVDPLYRQHYFRPPVLIETGDPRYNEKWITYANPYFSAKELTIQPGQHVVVRDETAYGCVVIQSHGQIGVHAAEVPGLLRYGQPSADEFFVCEEAARSGVSIKNESLYEPMVILKHFGPNNTSAPQTVPSVPSNLIL